MQNIFCPIALWEKSANYTNKACIPWLSAAETCRELNEPGEEQKKMIENRIRNPIYIGGEDCDDPSGRKMEPWHRETLRYVLKYFLPHTVMGSRSGVKL